MAMKLATVVLLALSACGSAQTGGSSPVHDVELPGVDLTGFTPREKHEFSAYVTELGAPCKEVAVPISQCVLENRPCSACLPAAQEVARAVREGMAREQVEQLFKQQEIPLAGSPSRGPEDAPVVVIEFADFECPFCQKIAPELDALWDKRKDKVRLVYKFMPLGIHPHSEPAARAAIAAQDQGKFWEMHHQLFANGQHLEPSDIDGYAKAVGLDLDRFHADMDAPATTQRIAADKKLADDLGVQGTPTLFIDGKLYDSKVDLEHYLDQEIAQKAK
jgi:protein-disulfide isomerase